MTYPLAAVRKLALHTQGLTSPLSAQPPPTLDAIYDVVERIGCAQIDTLQMVQRSHYLTVWSRLGRYDPADLDRLTYDPNHRRLFEYWYHAACLIPLTEYRYRMTTMRWWREVQSQRQRRWLAEPANAALMTAVLARIGQEGPLRTADFHYDGPQRGSWWDWKPAKRALEYLFDQGELMIADRINFQRVYDLRERVLPDWVNTAEPSREETQRHVLSQSVRALGACKPNQAASYTHDMQVTTARPYVADLIAEGVFVAVQAELSDGGVDTLIVHRDNLPLLAQAADGALPASRTTFLNPFDPLFYPQDRDVQFWNFNQVLEAYKPAAQRRWGYYCLPILHGDRLIGRFDPKLERKTGALRLKALYLEPDVMPGEELTAAVAAAMRDFMVFHAARDLVIERSEPADFGERLLAAL